MVVVCVLGWVGFGCSGVGDGGRGACKGHRKLKQQDAMIRVCMGLR